MVGEEEYLVLKSYGNHCHQVKVNQLVHQLQEQGESKEQRGAAKALEKEVAHYKKLVRELRRGNEDVEMTLARKETEESLSRPVSVVSHIQVKYFIKSALITSI